MNNVGVIDTFLNTFTTYIDSGFGLIKGEVTYLSSTLIVIDITLAGLFWAWGADEDILQRLVKKTLYIGFFAFIITNFTKLSGIIFNSFAGLGLKAGGSSISTADFLRPGRLAQVGLDAGQPLLDAASQMMGFTSFFANFVQIAVLMVSWLLVLIAFFILAVQLFITLLEFKLTTLAGFILIPFALFNKTAFLAEKVLGNVVASGVKVMVLAVIVGIGTGLFSQFTTAYAGGQPTIEQALSVVLAALAMLGLGIFGPGIATGLVSGAPQLGAGAAVGTGLAVAGTAMVGGAVFGLAGRGAMAASSGAAAAARGGAAMAGGMSSAYSLASAGRSGAGGVASGLGGAGRAAASGAVAPVRRAASRTAGAMTESFTSGARAGVANTGGSSTMGTIGSGEAANDGAASRAPSESGPPAWAQRVKRNQTVIHGAQTAAQALKSGDSHGGGHSVDLSGGE
ncbi:P-type conjugative transfer protein TrbL [Bradyrhizobium viridifuturi]|nr:P-type conjugative transfer protein TrbL [Bradyrhizobium viridifuturi]MBR1045014.1 P-type conjugative transfer protein TrbL [Bradyrhizobium viridifuturi]MBR1085628.1 P-type conjugative transfer protein TrbL [Bradyrhizobium viridifuturi]MBR1096318.1 P-type conjugative transfer protein TrbL [Bradyrhizobium viridifuturi]MBR1103400.1 P-type conjugative transfer protein TrbL [Bradyrhizobium viridifuturi]